jgi:hypothetical protein
VKPAGFPLLPALICAGLAAGGDRFAAPGSHEVVAVDRSEPPLVARSRPVALHGFAPAEGRGPLVLVAARAGAPAFAYDACLRHLASHGFTALVVVRETGEPWMRYADAFELAARQIPFEARNSENSWSRQVDPAALALVADRDCEVVAARAAARVPGVGALALVEGDDAGIALPWLDRTHAPFLFIAATEEGDPRETGRRSFDASGAAPEQRLLVQLHAAGPLFAPQSVAMARPVLPDFHALLARFLAAELTGDPGASLSELERLGEVERDVLRATAPVELTASHR